MTAMITRVTSGLRPATAAVRAEAGLCWLAVRKRAADHVRVRTGLFPD